ncbi:hypothetical protein [Kitasatospora sp. NPDC008115]|uniref:hypothetical protein n=1 Tax=Kitasatospora sp. NPDC008115 TaxID=3364022 RepID=UPI0036E97022
MNDFFSTASSPRQVVTVGASLLLLALPTAAPAAAQGRSSSACTHNWSGPQVCIAVDGWDNRARRLTARWTNPPGGRERATAIIHEGDEQREIHIRAEGRRQGKEILAEWQHLELAWGKLCVSFVETPGVWACQDLYSTGRG